MGRDAESAALKATSVDVVLEEPKRTARSGSCAAAPLEVQSRRRSMNVVRKVPLRRCTRHSTDESHAALTKVQPTDAHFSLESASLSASGDDEGQARELYRHGSPPTAPDTTMTVSKMRSPPPVADAVGQRSLHGSPQCCDSLPRTQLTSLGHSHALDGRQEAADSEIPGCSPNPPLVIFRSPFAVVGTDLAPHSPIRASPEYVRSKDLSKVRESVSLLKQRDASGRKVLRASDRIYEADGRPTKVSGRVQHTDATQDKRIIRRANSAMLAEGVPRNLPATARTPVTIPTFTEPPPSRQSRYVSGVKRSASILSRTFSRSSSPSRSTPRADSATRPGTDIACDESIASFDRTSEMGSSASRDVIIRVLKGWR
ncbi:hypothetical protein BCV69DRAFT_44133 [Microstroma glucosiphilum]|uniref:Uncharacterized protein n=1 Tax=Pseudomicrostroma glucosiphilum TaxID=1684307 RepID=A0A316U2Y6_9BASI|nr:hypothetical protein BCV69DRAFT_44133 [Pseudomicrostroma glucosiphilum]PWN19607.1 hypothetical protein BCV69DRAFT_44133 [Pseudomicrostroma glucosiphilum]